MFPNLATSGSNRSVVRLLAWEGSSTGIRAAQPTTRCSGRTRCRIHMRALYNALQTLTGDDLAQRAAAQDRSFRDQGVTFSHSGEEWVFPLDLIPRLIPAAEWELVEAGVVQRVRALEAFLADVYGPAEVVRDGVVPRSVLTTSASFCRPAYGIQPPNGVRVHLAGIDLVRDQAGVLRVLEDNLRVPSGMSYVVENRRTMARVFPDLFMEQHVRPVASYPGRLLDALRRSAPAGVEHPIVVLLTPGVHNAAYFEHAFLARKMGIELVEGRDLFCHEHVLYMRSIGGQQRGRRIPTRQRRFPRPGALPVRFRGGLPRDPERCPRRATSRSPTRSATASPTTSSCTPMSRRSSSTTSASGRCYPTS